MYQTPSIKRVHHYFSKNYQQIVAMSTHHKLVNRSEKIQPTYQTFFNNNSLSHFSNNIKIDRGCKKHDIKYNEMQFIVLSICVTLNIFNMPVSIHFAVKTTLCTLHYDNFYKNICKEKNCLKIKAETCYDKTIVLNIHFHSMLSSFIEKNVWI